MERKTTFEQAREIMGPNFIGPEELLKIHEKIGIGLPENIWSIVPDIPYPEKALNDCQDNYILFLGIPIYKDRSPLTIVKMREHFGWNPNIYEPCFYNQDWYLNESFACQCSISLRWYLLKKEIVKETRGRAPDVINNYGPESLKLPTALLAVYAFFAYFFNSSGGVLWKNDYVWCQDEDANGDRIYVGRYYDPRKINKNGFSIHRYLSLNKNYGAVDCR